MNEFEQQITPDTKPIGEMTWKEIPDTTLVYEILESVGFPNPMILLKHLCKPNKKGKKPDVNKFVTVLNMSKSEVETAMEFTYAAICEESKIQRYFAEHPEQAELLRATWEQINEEPISVVVARKLPEWRKLLVEEGIWEAWMAETPITLMQKAQSMLTDKDILNMPLRELLEIDSEDNSFAEISIKAIADKFVALEEEERRKKARKKDFATVILKLFSA